MGLYTHHNNLLGKLQLLNIYDLTDTSLSRFIEDIQDRRTSARLQARFKKIRLVKPAKQHKPAKKKATKQQGVVKRGNSKTKRLGVGDSKA